MTALPKTDKQTSKRPTEVRRAFRCPKSFSNKGANVKKERKI